jgi:hypothetical protein
MPLVSVPAVFDGERIHLLERPPVSGSYRVVVTFVEPMNGTATAAPDRDRFLASFGAWQDGETTEATVQRLQEARRSRPTPPAL